MLLTRRLDRAGASPLGFVANDYALARVGASATFRRSSPTAASTSAQLFDEDMLGDDLDAWLAESSLMKRTFRQVRRHRRPDRAPPSRAREVRAARSTMSTDLIYDVLRRHDPAPHPARGGLGRCGHRPARHRAARRFSAPHQGTNQASTPGPRLAAFRADPAGDRQGGRWRVARARTLLREAADRSLIREATQRRSTCSS